MIQGITQQVLFINGLKTGSCAVSCNVGMTITVSGGGPATVFMLC